MASQSCCLPEQQKQTPDPSQLDLIISSGGAAAVLGGTGSIAACQLAGLMNFRRIGGVSGGSIVAVLTAAGLPASQLLHMTLETSFSDHLKPEHGSMFRLLKLIGRGLKRELAPEHIRVDQVNSRHGLYGTDTLGHFIEKMVAEGMCKNGACIAQAETSALWPSRFWTMATTKTGAQVVFDADGVHHIDIDGTRSTLSPTAASTGTAVRASCTIPGVLACISYKDVWLYDGALSRDGICPVGLQIRHFGATASNIIACRIGEDLHRPVSGRLHSLARKIWKVDPEFHWGPETEGVIECRPQIDHVHTLKFKLSEDEKWLAILLGFEATLSQLALHGILHGERLDKARSVLRCLGFWRDAIPAALGSRQVLADRAERCFSEHGLF
ncbi:MAG: patatin-like phospholipase family protein [Candidatus Obscuribacterales bacterium]|jgi:predicted acylesterase/phospholipase RssA|nr:patatin-like phospholipase family protein [Candidatus Obscuribacterales bacterium]